MAKQPVTLNDLAKELGISPATVSRALKDYPDISIETKKRVQALAKAWQYRPNSLAVSLRSSESKIIGVIIPEIVNHFFSAIIKGIMQIAYDKGYRVMICQSDESYEKEVADVQALKDSRVDGILVSLASETKVVDHFQELLDNEIPIVLFDKISSSLAASKVIVDDFEGAYKAVTHLIEQGCKRIAHFRGPMVASTSSKRFEGYKTALQDHGLQFDQELVVDCNDMTLEEGKLLTTQVLRLSNKPDGIFAINDAVAIGAISRAKELGQNIPEDLAIFGFSDWMISSFIEPPLSSVSQPGFEMGQEACKLLLKQIIAKKEGKKAEIETVTLQTKLMVRASTRK